MRIGGKRGTTSVRIINSVVLLVVTLLTSFYECQALSKQAKSDQVTLPGTSELIVEFRTFSGYITVGTKNMHYMFVESMNDPTTDPISFWTNGGPGCSGLLGFFTEQGPYRPNINMKLDLNEYAWNRVANMVFIESPVGVGYSYSDIPDDYVWGDAETAALNYALIQGFFERFPEYLSNDLYLSSESYGGHYMPTLAREIVLQNRQIDSVKLNFKGFAVGNPFVNAYSGMPALVETAWGHQLIAHPTIQRYRENWCSDTSHPDYELEKCEAVLNEIFLQFGTLNPYALDFPVCMEESEETGAPYTRGLYEVSRAVQRKWLLRHILPGGLRGDAGRALPLDVDARRLTYDPCEEDYMTAYLNLPEVKRALHVSEEVDWSMCSSTTKYRHVDSEVSMVSLYRELLQGPEKLRILVYSGDDDGVCGTVGTQEWIWDMGLEIPAAEDEWQVYSLQEQLVGFHTIWRDVRLGFLTIHGAGHEVPTYRPAVSLDMWEKFLNGYWTG